MERSFLKKILARQSILITLVEEIFFKQSLCGGRPINVKILKIYDFAFAVLLTLSISTFTEFYQEKVIIKDKLEDLFHNKAKGVYYTVNSRVVDYEQILKSRKGLFYESDSINAQDWKIYIENKKIDKVYPGI